MSALYGDSVLYHTSDGVAWITLNRPSARNRLDLPMATALGRACRLVMQDDEVRAVVVTGTADVFCEGDDSDGPAAAGAEERQAYLEARRAAAFIGAVEKPVAALLNGDAIDHGLELALACDFRLAAAGARFGMTQVTRGGMPWDGGTQRLPRTVGRAWAADLLLTGRLIDAQEALEIGLVHEVHPADRLAERGEAAGPLAGGAGAHRSALRKGVGAEGHGHDFGAGDAPGDGHEPHTSDHGRPGGGHSLVPGAP